MKKLIYLFSMLLVASLTSLSLTSCSSDDEGDEDGEEMSISDGWTDNGTTCYYKWTNQTHNRQEWMIYQFDGESDEALCIKATHYMQCDNKEGAKIIYDNYKTYEALGSSNPLGNFTNVKRSGTIVSYEQPDYIGKTKAYFKKAYGVISDEPDEPDTPAEPNVTESCLDGTWEQYKVKLVGKQKGVTVEDISVTTDPNTAEGTLRYVFDLSAKTCVEQISRGYGTYWETIDNYTFKFNVQADQSYGSIRFTNTLTNEVGDWKKVTKLNSSELVIVWKYTLPGIDGDPATDYVHTKYYKRIE